MAKRDSGRSANGVLATVGRWRRRLKWVRRLLVLASLAGVAVTKQRSRPSPPESGASGGGGSGRPTPSPTGPTPSPLAAAATTPAAEDAAVSVAVRERAAVWVEAGEDRLAVPDGYPVKVNARSGIYHLPGGRNYDRTLADRWYRSAADAEADGFRPSKSF